MSDATEPRDHSYVIASGQAALERLELLARIFWPTTGRLLERFDAFSVERFVDVGCGIGDVAHRISLRGVPDSIGVDVNADVVAAAMRRAEANGSSARYQVGTLDGLTVDPELRDADIVFARCLLSHLPDPRSALGSMLATVRPGGRVLVEDVEVGAVWASPPCEALDQHRDLYVAAARRLGAHPDVGARLAHHARALGATDVWVDIAQPVLRTAEDLQIHARTMEAIAEAVVGQGLASSEEVNGIVVALDEWARIPDTVATLPRIIQMSATRRTSGP